MDINTTIGILSTHGPIKDLQSTLKPLIIMIEGSLEVTNFRQYGRMEKQRWEESEKRNEEERRSEKRKSQKKVDAGMRKGKVAKH